MHSCSRSWSHLVRVTTHNGSRVVIYCTSERGTLKAVGDIDTAPGQRVAIRKGARWECTLSWARPECRVERRHAAGTEMVTRLICYKRNGSHVQPYVLTVTQEDASVGPVGYALLREKGVTYPAREAPYRRMASLTPEERKAYHDNRDVDRVFKPGTILNAATKRSLALARQAEVA